MSIWSEFKTNMRLHFRTSPDPKNYEGELIYDYPFIRNESGQIMLGNNTDKEAWITMIKQQAIDGQKQSTLFEKYLKKFDEYDQLVYLGLAENGLFKETEFGKQYEIEFKMYGDKLTKCKLSYQAQAYIGIPPSQSDMDRKVMLSKMKI